jgi:uncharacterized membrane protein YfcA
MGVLEVVSLIAIGLAGGIVTSLVGGASLVTFPALLATGLSPVAAAIVNLVALMPANLSAAWWDRSQLPAFGRDVWLLLAVTLAGAVVGAWLLLVTPEALFTRLVPLLLAMSTVLFAYAGHIAQWIESRSTSTASAQRSRWTITHAAMVPISIYCGYFGAGAGVMILAVLMVVVQGDYRSANAIKNLLAGANCLVASLIYAIEGAVVWGAVLAMTVGALVGAVIGIRIVRIAPRQTMRRVVIWLSGVLTLAFAWKYWL